MANQVLTQARVTQILHQLQDGHPSAAEQLLPLIYDELRSLAGSYFQQERRDHTLQPTALVHEAYLRLVNQNDVEWHSRAHFFAVAAHAMRRVLINHAERHNTIKRGGDRHRVTLCENTPSPDARAIGEVDLLALNEALSRLESMDERQCRVVELRFFGGLSVEETAAVLGVASRTVELDWRMARAWLYTQLIG